jgi:hypothetical protein
VVQLQQYKSEFNLKTNLVITLFLVLCLAPWACEQRPPINPIEPGLAPTSTPTPTSTPNQTPVCGFTALPSQMNPIANFSQYVIRNQTEWANLNGGVAAPVNFSTQMILEITSSVTGGCYTSTWPSFVSVCKYSDHIQVDYNAGGPPYANHPCNMMSYILAQVMVAVPQSNLPVSWIANN